MAKTNVKTVKPAVHTHPGAVAVHASNEDTLRRTVLACMLFEDAFYEGGETTAKRIQSLSHLVSPQFLSELAVEARSKYNLRHVSLLLARELARHPLRAQKPNLVSATIANTIQRADELAEFLAIYWRDKKDQPLSAQVKKGLALAFCKFNEHQLAKYNRDGDVKLRDVLFLCHAKPQNKTQERLFKKLVDNKLKTPDTWEVELSSGADKAETFTRLIKEEKLGALALLRNLRNMQAAGVSNKLVKSALLSANYDRVLPFRFLAAAKHAPALFADIDEAFLTAMATRSKLPGKTIIVVDVSGSMYGGAISAKSEMNRMEGAAALGTIARELCEDAVVYATAGSDARETHATKQVPSTRGLNLVKQICDMCMPLGGGGIFLTQAMNHIAAEQKTADRTIVITDEQDCARSARALAPSQAKPLGNGYLINVASYQNGIGRKNNWETITGFSEAVFQWIEAHEANESNQ